MSLRPSEVFAPPRAKRGKPEREIQNKIVGWLRSHGVLVAVTDAGAAHKAGFYSGSELPEGWPDLTCCLPGGRFCGIEVKAPNGRQSDGQKQWEDRITETGGLYVLAHSVEEVAEEFAAAGVKLWT